MPRKEPSGKRRRGGTSASADRLSELPDELLHRIMSFLKAWEVVRTCVLSRRWRNVWASAPCIDVRVGRNSIFPVYPNLAKFVYQLLLARDALAPVDTLRLRSPESWDLSCEIEDIDMWIRHSIKRKARVIQLVGHPRQYAELNKLNFVSSHLKVLKVAYADVFIEFSRQLSSGCPHLEELELNRCLVETWEIKSASLKRLIMVRCTFAPVFSVNCPNLLFVRCVEPERWTPVFRNLGSLVTASVMLEDHLLGAYFHDVYGHSDSTPTSDDSDESSDDSGYSSDDTKEDSDYGSGISSDIVTYKYSEIANTFQDRQFGNCYASSSSKSSNHQDRSARYVTSDCKNILHNLSNAQSLELLGHSGEVILRAAVINCPIFSNLKTLALGEWCISMGGDFGKLVMLLQHSPNLEKLILQLEMNDDDVYKGIGIQLEGGSFACEHISMVKIKCTKDDPRVHLLAQLFKSNGIPLEKIYVQVEDSSPEHEV